MKTILPVTLLSAALSGCTGAEPPCNSSLPGDVDCASSNGAGGKADAWDDRNDPRNLSRTLNYRVDELPQRGEVEGEVWAGDYWPTLRGSTIYRWQGQDELSPLEKYDLAFNGWDPGEDWAYASFVPDACGDDASDYLGYIDTLGPAARWQSTYQGRDRMFDGVDNDDDGEADECDSYEQDGLEGWWGLCHAWAPAALLEPVPLHPVEHGGVRFEVSDIKALILTAYDGTSSLFLGGRCNAREFERDANHRITQDECRDVNAGAWHVIITNFLGESGKGFVKDLTTGSEVWNHPVVSYEIFEQRDIDLDQAGELLEVDVSSGEYPFNPDAERFVEVQMQARYLVESSAAYEIGALEQYIQTRDYHYILEIGGNDKIIGGEWVGPSKDDHPDFLWVPTGVRPGTGNPGVDLQQVRELLRLSRE